MTSDKALGLNSKICRRDFINGVLLASGGRMLESPAELFAQKSQAEEWNGPGGVGDYQHANGNTWDVTGGAHQVRDHVYDAEPTHPVETGEVYDLIVIGGGISGLSAGLFFRKEAGSNRTCLILENHSIFGGNARRNEFIVDGQRLIAPQGSNLLSPPVAPGDPYAPAPDPGTGEGASRYPTGDFLNWFYDQNGLDWRDVKYQSWAGPGAAMQLSHTSYNHARQMPPPPDFGFYFGARFGQDPGMWVRDPWGSKLSGSPLASNMRAEILKYINRVIELRTSQPPEEDLRHLDSMTAEDRIIELCGVSRETIRLYLAPHSAAADGLGPDALSGCLARGLIGSGRPENWRSLPGGNAGIARLTLKTLIDDAIPGPRTLGPVCRNDINFAALDRPTNPVRLRLSSTVVRVEHDAVPEKSSSVAVIYAKDGKLYRVKARAVIMAGGGWMTRRIVRDMPSTLGEAYNTFCYSAFLVANVAVRNWRFLYKLGLAGGRWFEGFGYWTNVRTIATFGASSNTIGPDSPTVLSLYVPLFYPGLPTVEQGHKGRTELISTAFRVYERKIREQFVDMFARSGFDAQRDIAGIILNRWGHAMVNAQPGFYYGVKGQPAPRDLLRNRPFGRISFAHTDLTGRPDHSRSVAEAYRAVRQVLPALRS